MFEHFGLKDVISGLWKFKYHIIAVTVAFAVIGAVISFVITEEAYEKTEYQNSQTFYFQYKSEDGGAEGIEVKTKPANVLAAMLDEEVCKEYVREFVLQSYSEEQVLELTGNQGSDIGLVSEMITKSSVYSILANGDAMSILVTAEDEEYANVIAEAYESFLQSMKETLPDLEIIEVGEISRVNVTMETGIGMKEYVVLFGMLGAVLSCIVVFFICLWVPTMNRKNDFEEYGVFVLGEVKEI